MSRPLAILVAALFALSMTPVAGSARVAPAGDISPGAFAIPRLLLRAAETVGIDMAVADDGHVHLVVAVAPWETNHGVWYLTDRTGSWTARRIVATDHAWVYPSIALDERERVHIAVLRAICWACGPEETRWSEGIFYLSDVGRARGTFGTPTRLTRHGVWPSLAVGSGHVWLGYQGDDPGIDDGWYPVRLRTNATGSWTTTTIASRGRNPSLQVGADGHPRLAFASPRGLRYARARTLTGDWVIEGIAGSARVDQVPVLAIDSTGRPHVSWLDYFGGPGPVAYARRTSGGWTSAVEIGRGFGQAIDVHRPASPWVLVGSAARIRAFHPVGGAFAGSLVSADGIAEGIPNPVAIAVAPSGMVAAAWVGGSPRGIWFSRG